MRRLPDDRRLAAVAVARTSAPAPRCVDAIADLLAALPRTRPRPADAIDRSATPAALTDLWTSSLDELRPFAGPVLDPSAARPRRRGRAALPRGACARSSTSASRADGSATGTATCSPTTCSASTTGHASSTASSSTTRLRFGDVLADVAFLAMDLERLGRRDLARRLLDRYRAASGDRLAGVARALLRRVPRARAREGRVPARSATIPTAPNRSASAARAGGCAISRQGACPHRADRRTARDRQDDARARALGRATGLAGAPLRRGAQGARRPGSRRRRPPRRSTAGSYSASASDRTYDALLDRARRVARARDAA